MIGFMETLAEYCRRFNEVAAVMLRKTDLTPDQKAWYVKASMTSQQKCCERRAGTVSWLVD
jgi:hypothetical protein